MKSYKIHEPTMNETQYPFSFNITFKISDSKARHFTDGEIFHERTKYEKICNQILIQFISFQGTWEQWQEPFILVRGQP